MVLVDVVDTDNGGSKVGFLSCRFHGVGLPTLRAACAVAYFHRYASLSAEAALARALEIWRTINLKNLDENILPTRQRARLILRKGANHRIESVLLRKL